MKPEDEYTIVDDEIKKKYGFGGIVIVGMPKSSETLNDRILNVCVSHIASKPPVEGLPDMETVKDSIRSSVAVGIFLSSFLKKEDLDTVLDEAYTESNKLTAAFLSERSKGVQ